MTDRAESSARSEARAPSLPSVSLPKGGGAIRGIGEKFGTNPVTGTGSLSVPIFTSPGRSGFGPQLSLSYDSGSGNGPFGFGWTSGVHAITRKTDKGLPRYLDGEESDVFILAGAEDLVPLLDDTHQRVMTKRTVHNIDYEVRPYRPRIEGLFARIERWTAVATGISHWRVISRDNVTTLYGFEPLSRIADPDAPTRIFSFLICRTFDDKGNIATYEYLAEDDAGIERFRAHEANRPDSARTVQRYLKTIRYGNTTPWFADWTTDGGEPPLPTNWHFQVVFDYGDHDPVTPKPLPDRAWPVRVDPFSNYRACFEVRTYRRCERVLMFHAFPDERGVGSDCLVRSTDFVYSDETNAGDPVNPVYTFLESVTHKGYRRQGNGYLSRPMPPVEFAYSRPVIQPDVLTLDHESLTNLPEGLGGTTLQWVDLDGEGMSGALTDDQGGWRYKRNSSPTNQVPLVDGSLATRARLDPAEILGTLPSRTDLHEQRLLDLSGDGRLDVVTLDTGEAGFFERTEDWAWAPFRPFASLPVLNWSEPNVKFIDLTGDGLADVLLTEDGAFTIWESLGAEGFAAAERVTVPTDEARGPAVVLADGTDTVFLADMSGDGLSDLVRVRNGEVCYWPNLGYGHFGPKVTMDRAPRIADSERFDPHRIRLTDIDASGTTDLLYIGADGVQVWFNQSGNGWGAGQRIAVFPGADLQSGVQVMDLLGTGTACLVWSSPLPAHAGSPIRYVDLMGGVKPHLLINSKNNLGAETRVRYAPSTRFYVADRQAGHPWVTRLPHVVHVVERVETFDWVGRSRFVTRYAYHHGSFDGFEREFRGFGMVEQWDTDDHREDTEFPEAEDTNWDAGSWSPPMLTRTWFHTGAFIEAGNVSRQYTHEYWVEPALRPDARADDRKAMSLPDTVLPNGLTAAEIREAYRSLKGSPLRTEVYGQNNDGTVGNPYAVTEHNYTVRLLQHFGPNRHAAFLTHARESLSFHYERQPDDPRVTHDVVLEVDDFGNALRSAAVGYPRRPGYSAPEPALSQQFQDMLAYDQTRLHVSATANAFTNAVADPATWPDDHRTPATAEVVMAELTGIAPTSSRPGITNLFAFDELDQGMQGLWSGARDIPYEEIPSSDVDGAGTPASGPTRRIVERTRTVYRSDDLQQLLPLGQLQSLALPGDSYRLALTSTQVTRVFGTRVSPTTLAEGGYVSFTGVDGWWMPSGRLFYSAGDGDTATTERGAATAHFYLPRRLVDPLGGISRVAYDPYDLLPASATDPVGNVTQAASDYRVLLPITITEPNDNRASAMFDVFGLVVATAVNGKVTENLGDSVAAVDPDLDPAVAIDALLAGGSPSAVIAGATTRMLYDIWAYQRTQTQPQPSAPVVYTVSRDTHVSTGAVTGYLQAYGYSDGFGREIQKKSQAEPGPLVQGGPTVTRWVGSGWTIFNNKGKPVRKYEPFFTATPVFEFAAQVGVSSVLFYDPADRVVATLHPNDTWEKVVFGPWREDSWDVNDTVSISDPRQDTDVGEYFARLLGNAPNAFTSWYNYRIGGVLGAAERQAAVQTSLHAESPTVTHFDALGRKALTVSDNRSSGRYPTRTAYDTEGKPLAVFDALGRRVFEYCLREPQGASLQYIAGTDVAGNGIFQNGMDGGARRMLGGVTGKPIRLWDARGHAFSMKYDPAQRVTHRWVATNGGPSVLLERLVYGEGNAAANLCGRLWRHYDTAGLVSSEAYDFKGNLTQGARQLAATYTSTVDWSVVADVTDQVSLDAKAGALLIPDDRFVTTTAFDALNRPIQTVTPFSVGMHPNVLQPRYNKANLLDGIDVWLQQGKTPSGLLDVTTADAHAVTNIDYNARGQRLTVGFGNGVVTTHDYDPTTFRLIGLQSTRPSSFGADERTVQDLSYTHDPTGNITHLQDDADNQQVIFFNNVRVDPSSDYVYDPIYRLTSATGREHLGQSNNQPLPPVQVTNDDSSRMGIGGVPFHSPTQSNVMGRYTEQYGYDGVGNLLSVGHVVGTTGWTRAYDYRELSAITSSETNNRLSSTSLPGDLKAPYSATYAHDDHGNMTAMPHLAGGMTWDEQDRLRSTASQKVNVGLPETTYYTYDAKTERQRKVTNAPAAPGSPGVMTKERIYLGPLELYREYDANGNVVRARETVHVMAGAERVALIEIKTAEKRGDKTPAQLVRYQHGNHLESAVLELDDQARIVSYEEFFPYGSTAYQAVGTQTDVPKRYRYTGKERDEENDLNYHGARYYATWLGRWTACDPAAHLDEKSGGGVNLYAYVDNRPVVASDPDGALIFLLFAAVLIGGLLTTQYANAPTKADAPLYHKGAGETALDWADNAATIYSTATGAIGAKQLISREGLVKGGVTVARHLAAGFVQGMAVQHVVNKLDPTGTLGKVVNVAQTALGMRSRRTAPHESPPENLGAKSGARIPPESPPASPEHQPTEHEAAGAQRGVRGALPTPAGGSRLPVVKIRYTEAMASNPEHAQFLRFNAEWAQSEGGALVRGERGASDAAFRRLARREMGTAAKGLHAGHPLDSAANPFLVGGEQGTTYYFVEPRVNQSFGGQLGQEFKRLNIPIGGRFRIEFEGFPTLKSVPAVAPASSSPGLHLGRN